MKSHALLLIVMAGVYILLFEYILPVNFILPKPSLLIESFNALGSHYSFWFNLVYTAGSVYLWLFISVMLLVFLSGYYARQLAQLCQKIHFCPFSPFRYFPLALLAVLLVFWFKGTVYSEQVFLLIVSMSFVSPVLRDIYPLLLRYSTIPAASDKLKKINLKRLWNISQPVIFRRSAAVHIYIWSCALFFEYLNKARGLGAVLYTALTFRDLAVIILTVIITVSAVVLMDAVIKLILRRILYWETDVYLHSSDEKTLELFEYCKENAEKTITNLLLHDNDGNRGNISLLVPEGNGRQCFLEAVSSIINRKTDTAQSVAYIPAYGSSLPWLSVMENIEEVYHEASWQNSSEKLQVKDLVNIVGLRGYEKHFADNRSAGFRFRIVLARVLAAKCRTIIIDDPFGKMKAPVRSGLFELLKKVSDAYGIRIIFITDNIERAVLISNTILVYAANSLELLEELNLPDKIEDRENILNVVMVRLASLTPSAGFSVSG